MQAQCSGFLAPPVSYTCNSKPEAFSPTLVQVWVNLHERQPNLTVLDYTGEISGHCHVRSGSVLTSSLPTAVGDNNCRRGAHQMSKSSATVSSNHDSCLTARL